MPARESASKTRFLPSQVVRTRGTRWPVRPTRTWSYIALLVTNVAVVILDWYSGQTDVQGGVTMATQRAVLMGMTMLLVAGACESEDGAFDAVTVRGLETNGFQLNGFQLNGFQLNGFQLNGFQLNGERLDGASGTTDYIQISQIDLKGGDKGSESWLAGSVLTIKGKKGVVSTGTALVGAAIEYELSEGGKGKKKSVRIAGVAPLALGSDVMLYQLEIYDGTWKPLCENGKEAILLGDLWDPASGERISDASDGTLTFACRGAALAKCVEYGYRPWASVANTSLRDHHQACTRMVRADYCGEGVSHTANGTPIHVLDQVGVQNVDPNVNYVVEAEWGLEGATCLNAGHRRHPEMAVACQLPACGASFSSGGLIQSGKVLAP